MNEIPKLLQLQLAFCKGKASAEDVQFWEEWLERGVLLYQQTIAAPQAQQLAVNFATQAAPMEDPSQ